MLQKFLTLLVAVSVWSQSPADADSESTPFPGKRAAAQHFLRPIFPVLDCEGVGVVEKGEIDEHFFQLFYYKDRNYSKSISKNEFLRSSSDDSLSKDEFVFRLMDTNKDGKVSTREFRNHVIAAIGSADVDRDGEVTKAEIFPHKSNGGLGNSSDTIKAANKHNSKQAEKLAP